MFFRGLTAALVMVLAVSGTAAIAVAVSTDAAQAQSTVIQRIDVQGNRRVESAAIISYLTISVGERYDAFKVDQSFKALFASGLFSDVKITLQRTTLVVAVVENPIINRVAFEGNRKLTDKTLENEVQSRPRVALTSTRVQSDVQRILVLYRRSGRFNATVEPKIIDLGQNRVDLVFEISEGGKTGVSRINFIGNRAFSDRALRKIVSTGETGLLSFLRSNDVYDPDRLAHDTELLRRHYLRSGYADFRVVSAVADLDQQSNAFFITITVDEGERYKFGAIEIESNVRALDPNLLRGAVHTYEGNTYNLELIDRTLEDLTLEVSKLGYAFAQIVPRGDRDASGKLVSITYVIDEGPRVYIERIDVRGNTRTQDRVIRREFDLVEGDPYNRVLIERAKRRLNGLDFFKEVKIRNEPGSARDRVIVVIDVEEEATGSFAAGVGYSTSDGILGDVSITERNLLGRGQFIRLALSGSSKRTDIDFSFTEPYFMDRRLAAGIDLFSRELDLSDESAFKSTRQGGGVRFGFQITPELSVNTRYVFTAERTTQGATTTATSAAVLAELGTDYISQVGYTVRYDTIDNKKDPRNGIYASFSQDVAGLGGTVNFIRTTAEARVYHEIVADIVALLRVEGGHIAGFGSKDVRISDAFFKGGETIRGFARGGIGPRDAAVMNQLGGKVYAVASAELQFPIPFVPDELGFRGAVFADAGTVFDTDTKGKLFDTNGDGIIDAGPITVLDSRAIRSSVGASLLWNSPFGPLRVDYAYVLSKQFFDAEESFRFGAGTRF